MHVVRACYYPLFADDELGTTYWYLTHLETFHQRLRRKKENRGNNAKTKKQNIETPNGGVNVLVLIA
jgi:hypothetical protein